MKTEITTGIIDLFELIEAAKNLKSEDGENPEYDRALCELIARVSPVEEMPTQERAKEVASVLGIE